MTYAPIPNEDIDVGSPLTTALVTQLRDTGEYARIGYQSVSGATQDLDLEGGRTFDAGTLTSDTTLTFSNEPTEARWTYTYKAGLASGAYDVTTAEYNGEASLSQDTHNEGVFVKPDGTKLYTVGRYSDDVFEYDMISGSVSSISFNQNEDISSTATDLLSVVFKSDGTKMYVGNQALNRIHQFSLSTAWDISTLSSDNKYFIAGNQGTPFGLHFDASGTRLYMAGDNYNLHQYSLSTAWDISTTSFVRTESFPVAEAHDIKLSADGTKVVTCNGNDGVLKYYTLSTAWDISTRSSILGSFNAGNINNVTGFTFNSDGSVAYIVSEGEVGQYNMGTAPALTVPASVQNPSGSSVSPNQRVTLEYLTADGGTNVYLINETVV